MLKFIGHLRKLWMMRTSEPMSDEMWKAVEPYTKKPSQSE